MRILQNHTPRWLIFLIDIFISFVSIVVAFQLRFNFEIPDNYYASLVVVVPFVLSIRAISFVISKVYAGIIRYTSTKDTVRVFIVVLVGTIVIAVVDYIYFFIFGIYLIPQSIIIIDFLATIFTMITGRMIVKTLYLEYHNPSKGKENIIIYGTTELSLITKRTLDRDELTTFKVIAFIDSNKKTSGKKLEGIPIYYKDELTNLINKYSISTLVFAKKCSSKTNKSKIIDTCLNLNVKVLTIPNVDKWINGELSLNQIKKIKIEDLLERDPINLDEKEIRSQLLNKTVLVSGAAGSIGSEIVTQLSGFNPKQIILFDQAESPLYDIELKLREKHSNIDVKIIIGDITNKERLHYIFNRYKPNIIYHAAAYKHVPMMEKNPAEAINTNIFGTKNIADVSAEFNVEKFVMVSTDKAVNPTNVMGASKRIAEIYTQSLNGIANTKFITTRFGNVLGSNGSVIPRFRKQIENGGPVTVTHPDITRFFMTIPEACQLVLEAGAIGRGGEIFIFDMGKSVRIVDLAKKMIKLSGLSLGTDIHLKYTGLRPGEKLYEELLNDKENTMPTHNSQIMIAKVSKYENQIISEHISDLKEIIKQYDNYKIVKKMKDIVPEFISKNSVYEELDK